MGSQIIVVADVWRMDWRGPRLKKGGTIFEEDLTSLLNSLDVIHEGHVYVCRAASLAQGARAFPIRAEPAGSQT